MAIKAVPGYTTFGGNKLFGGGYSYKPAVPQKTVPQLAKSTWGNVAGSVPGSALGLPGSSAGGGQSNAAAGLNYAPPAGSGAPAGGTVSVVRTPNEVYQSDILNDWQSQAGQATYSSTLDKGMQGLRDAISGNVVSSGWDPGDQMTANNSLAGFRDLVTQATRDQAAANPLSEKAQLQKSLSEGLYSLPYQLAATGSQRSGAANINATKLNQQYDVASQQSLTALLNAIKGNVGDYTNLASGAADALNQARAAAAARLAAQAGYSEMTTMSGGGDGGGDYADNTFAGGGGGYSGVGPTTPAAVRTVLKQPGAVSAMGGPAQWANAMSNTVKPKTATAIKKIKAGMLVGRDY